MARVVMRGSSLTGKTINAAVRAYILGRKRGLWYGKRKMPTSFATAEAK